MTCIVGIIDKKSGKVHLGGDSAAGGADFSIIERKEPKVFKNGDFVIGFCDSFRMGQILRYKFIPPRQRKNIDDNEYMATDFIDGVKKCFSENGFGSFIPKEENKGGEFLVGYNGTLYVIEEDFQVGVQTTNYYAIGIGQDLALGAFYATESQNPTERMEIALKAASRFNSGVREPFNYVSCTKRSKK